MHLSFYHTIVVKLLKTLTYCWSHVGGYLAMIRLKCCNSSIHSDAYSSWYILHIFDSSDLYHAKFWHISLLFDWLEIYWYGREMIFCWDFNCLKASLTNLKCSRVSGSHISLNVGQEAVGSYLLLKIKHFVVACAVYFSEGYCIMSEPSYYSIHFFKTTVTTKCNNELYYVTIYDAVTCCRSCISVKLH